MRDTIEMAREAGLSVKDPQWGYTESHHVAGWLHNLKAFEALVRADQDEKYKWNVHSCGPTCTKAACVATRKAVEAEREACAKTILSITNDDAGNPYKQALRIGAEAIRARGETK